MATLNAVIYIEKKGITYISIGKILEFLFTPEVVSYLDVINEELFQSKLSEFISTNKLIPATISIVLGPDTLFEKEFPLGKKSEIPQNDVDHFVDTVPFEEVGQIQIKKYTSILIVATNATLYETIKKVFVKHSFEVISATPFITITSDSKYFMPFDASKAKSLLEKFYMLKQNNMLIKKLDSTQQSTLSAIMQTQIGKEEKKSNSRVFLLIGVFVVLIGVMAFMFMNMQKQNAKYKQAVVPTPLPPIATPIVSPTTTQSASLSATIIPSISPTLTVKKR